MIGATVSHYTILEKLGQGGMGVVYKAEDTRLRRTVALKFLPPSALANEEDRTRFIREAQAAASLDHPNICTIYEIDELEGQPFIAMAYVDGQSLRSKIQTGPLRLEHALDIAVQVAEGLQAAHEKGIVHRDIKTANVMLTGKDQAKIMDFGLAQLAGQTRVTRTGTTLGTPAYMSPEQASGDPVDHRTDIWSLGVVLHEIIAGQLPFKGTSEVAVVHSILHSSPEPLTALRSGVPLELERIVNKAMAKRPADRYQHADEMLVDLRALRKQWESGSSSRETTQQRAVPSIAVLPFVNMNRDEDSEFFSDGITEELISALSKVEQLRVVSRTSAFQFKGKTQDIREIGERLKVGTVLEGSVRRAGNRVRVMAQLVNIADGYQVWSERYDREMKDVFDIQDEISRAIVDALRVKLMGEEQQCLVRCRTCNPEAHELYLKGLYHLNRFSLGKGLEYCQQAIAADPNYPLPYVGVARAYSMGILWGLWPPRQVWTKVQEAASRALELDDTLAEAHAAMALVKSWYEHNWAESERHSKRALQLSPGDATSRWWYALSYLTPLGRLEEARLEMRRILESDPLSVPLNTSLAWVFWHSRKYDEAIAQSQKVLEWDPNYLEAWLALGCAHTTKSQFGEAFAAFEKARAVAPAAASAIGLLGWAKGLAGDADAAKTCLAELEELSKQRYVSINKSWVHIGLGDLERALDGLEQGYQERDAMVCFIKVAPAYDPLHSSPRYTALLKKIGLE